MLSRYLVVIESDVEPSVVGGPYASERDRIMAAARIRQVTDEDGVFRLDLHDGEPPVMEAFLGYEIEQAIEELECSECQRINGGFGPRHFASDRCESNKYTHCTCNICF